MVLAQKFLLVKFYRIGAGFSNAGIIVIAKISEFLLFVNVIVTISEVFSFCFIIENFSSGWKGSFNIQGVASFNKFYKLEFFLQLFGIITNNQIYITLFTLFTFLFSFFPDYKRLPILTEHLLWCDEPYFSVFKPISLPANVPAAPKPIKFT